jgi:hypothetical protein
MNEWRNFFLSVKNVNWPDFAKLAKLDYLTDSAVSVSSPLNALLGYFFLLMILSGLVINLLLTKRQKKYPIYSRIKGHINNLTLWLGIIGIFLVLARFQAIYLLSNRILMLLLLLITFIWSAWIIYYSIRYLPKIKKEYIKRQEYQRYLPKKKVKKII